MSTFAPLTISEFGSLFSSFKKTAFRLETLQRYAVDAEEAPFRDFLANKERYMPPGLSDWLDIIKANIASGKNMSRVHIVTEPLTDYVRFEISWGYRYTVEAGEDVRLIPVAAGAWPSDLPKQDFWLFDSQQVIAMKYEESGAFVGVEGSQDPDTVKQYVKWSDAALTSSTPLLNYIRT